jgi:hypothetical protein
VDQVEKSITTMDVKKDCNEPTIQANQNHIVNEEILLVETPYKQEV